MSRGDLIILMVLVSHTTEGFMEFILTIMLCQGLVGLLWLLGYGKDKSV